ncbi:MAG: radical SAM protein [Candidatus Omnitrophica bacterium]|nr:radical SAM protein [Candidatus Omnitrophota bacterium]
MGMTVREKKNRVRLQEKKPLAYEKIIKHPEKIKNKECVALIQLQYRYDCNFKCKHCAIEKFKKKDERLLSIADVKRIADQADAMGLASICISGGEPLIFPDLKNVVDAIGPARFVISMDTNGWLLSEEKIKWLVEIGVDRIHLSIDGLEYNHNMFRGVKGSWKKCIEALKYCNEYGLGVIINIVATKSLINSGELIKQLDYISQFGEHASIIYAKPTGAFQDYKDEILDTKDIEYIQSLQGKYNISTHLSANCGHEFGCLCIKRHFSITAYGDVLPCPWIPISIGNIFNEDLETVVKRGLGMKWFSYDNKYSCQCGNRDSFFYQNILPQVDKSDTYPADWKKINWF